MEIEYPKIGSYQITFNLRCTSLKNSENLYIIGNIPKLGIEKSIKLSYFKPFKYLSEKITIMSDYQFEFEFLIFNSVEKS